MTNEYIQRIISVLNRCNVNYIVTGGVAMFLRNEKKSTMDIDVLVTTNQQNIIAIKEFVKAFNIVDLKTVEDLKQGKIVRVKIFPFSIDFLPKLDGLKSEDAFNNSEHILFNGINIPVITKKDLLTNYNNIYEQIRKG